MARTGRELYLGVTDSLWYEFLSSRPQIDEVNFWRPGGGSLLRAPQGAPFAFKLHAPHNAVAGVVGGRAMPALYLPRQGQGTFRRLVLAAYNNQCTVTGEHSVPVIDAAHIANFSIHQRHEISNGIALRSDIHKLFDRGYVSIRPDHTFVVSKALGEEFNNGKVYYKMRNTKIRLPNDPALHPSQEYLEQHYAKLRT